MSSFRDAGSANVPDRSRIADQIFKDLRDQIVRGGLPRGSKLPTERELAKSYGVSPPTIREAYRGLTAMGLADVRHGSGAYVTADAMSLIAMSLGTVIQLESVGAAEVLAILGVLNEQAAALASQVATEGDLLHLRQTLAAFKQVKSTQAATAAVRNFHKAIANGARNPLLSALCGFLVDLQTELGVELAGSSVSEWKQIFVKLKATRTQLVEAIVQKDEAEAVKMARKFQQKSFLLITSLPKAREVRLTDPKFKTLLSTMMERVIGS